MNSKSLPIIRGYYTLTGLYTLSASLIWGVNTIFLLEAGLTILQVFTVNAIFTGAMALFEIPTGVLADTRGRRLSFLLSIAILLIGTLGYVAAAQVDNNLYLFILTSILLGLGFTFYSGAMEAWLVDAINHTGFEGELDEIFARSAMISGAAMLVGSITGGGLGTINLAWPFVIRAILLGIVFGIAARTMFDLGFTPHKSGLKKLPKEMQRIAQASVKYGWQQRSIRLLIAASFGQAIFMAWGFYAWQPYFLDLLGRDAPWIAGIIAAAISISTMTGNRLVEWEMNRNGKRTNLMIAAAIVQTIAAIGVGLVNSFTMAVFLYLLVMAASGVYGPVKQAYMHKLTPADQRATGLSFESLVASGGSMFGQTGLGRIAQIQSLGIGYVVGGASTALVWPLLWILRRRKDEADIIIGAVGKESACGAQGLPQITGVDSQAGANLSL